MNVNDVQTLYAYNLWANRRMFSVLQKLTEEQFTAAVQSSFPSIRESVFHILAAEWIWLKRWKGTSPRASAPDPDVSPATWKGLKAGGIPTVQELSTLAELKSFAESIEQERQEYLLTLSDDDLPAILKFNDMAGAPYSEPLLQLLQHVVNHGSYHRGQVTTLLRQMGAQTVSLDMLFFFRETNEKAAAN